MRTILHVAQPTTGGVGRVVLGLAKYQVDAGLRVCIASPKGDLADQAQALGVPWIAWDSRRELNGSIPAEVRALRTIIGEIAPDVAHLHSSKAGLVGRLAIRGSRPTVFQPHAWSTAAVKGLVRRGAAAWERRALRWTDMTLFCSQEELREGAHQGISGTGRVVLNGVDLAAFTAAPAAQRDTIRRELALPASSPVVVVVGRRCHQKGQDIAGAAWNDVRRHLPDALLVLVGEGNSPDHDRPGIVSVGARSDVQKFLAAADVVLAPSRWEGLSLALLEGMASGRPTVAADVAGAREALLGGSLGPAGRVVPIDDPAQIAEAVVERLRQPALMAAEGAAARARAEARFNQASTFAAITESYTAVARQRSS